jgi:hypothetical protein
MTDEIEERFARVDQLIAAMDERLRTIARQNATLAEMVEVLGGYVNTSLEYFQAHVNDPDAHGPH